MMALPALFDDPNFTEEALSRPDGQGWSGVVGLAFSEAGDRIYAWEREGRVWIIDEANPVATPFLDIADEVLAWRDHGLLGFALDPLFEQNGYVYIGYIVDRHHLLHCVEPDAGVGAPICDQNYDPNYTVLQTQATIGRVVRYTAIRPQGAPDFSNAVSVDYDSRKVLIGESPSTGMAMTHQTHGIGQLVFGTDGTLLVAFGDGASYASTDVGSAEESAYLDALAEGILRPDENVGAYRAQMVNSHNGKILRIDPASGDGVASNPYYDGAAPRSPASRVWALGLRNPYRMTLKPGTGSHNSADADPGVLYVGDVGLSRWEEFVVVDGPAINFGWPVFEGMTIQSGYFYAAPNSEAASAALGCDVKFTDLIVQESQQPLSFPNPCGQGEITSVPVFEHRRPTLDWFHIDPDTRYPAFDGNGDAVAVGIGQPIPGTSEVLTQGTPFAGNASTGGTWYLGGEFPESYHNTYFHGDYGGQWIRNFQMSSDDRVTRVVPFASDGGGVVFIATHPADGRLYYISWASFIYRVSYAPGGNRVPAAVASADPIFGPSPLTVQFSSAGSSDPENGTLSFDWQFGDGASDSGPSPTHEYRASGSGPANYTATLTVTDDGSPPQSDSATLLVSLNNTPPQVTITSPADGTLYPLSGDTTYDLTAQITDAEHGSGELSCAWQTVLHHNNHTHEDPVDNNCSSQVQIAPAGCDGETYFYRVHLTVTDAHGLATTAVSTLYPDCGGVSPPVANDDSASVPVGGSVELDLLANDSDDTGLNPGSLTLLSQPASGQLTVLPGTGRVQYRPAIVTSGSVSFQYRISDVDGFASDPANVTIAIVLDGSTPVVATPVVTPGAGEYPAPLELTLSSATGGATLYYTLDGRDPDFDSAVSDGSLSLEQSATLKVWAYRDGYVPSSVVTEGYQLLSGGPTFPVDGLVGYWPLNEGGGTLIGDASGNGHDGQLSGATWTSGWDDGGLRFDGVDDHVVVPHSSQLAFTLFQSFSLTAWVQPDGGQGGWAGLVTKSRDQAPWYGLWITSWDAWAAGGPNAIFDGPISGGWHHLALVQDALLDSRWLYVDGLLAGTLDAQFGEGGGDLWFGGAAGIEEFFDGVLDEIRLYDRPLTAEEVGVLATAPPPAAGPVTLPDSVQIVSGASVDIDVLANDHALAGLDPASVEVVVSPDQGTITAIGSGDGVISYSHNGSGLGDGFSYRVRDYAGAWSAATAVTIGVQAYVPPTVAITAPQSGAQVSGNLVVQWRLSGDDSQYDHIHVRLDDNPHVTLHNTSLTSYDFGAVEAGEHSIEVWLVTPEHLPLANPEASDWVSVTVLDQSGGDPTLVGYWAMDSGSAQTALDSSGNQHHGQILGAQVVPGRFGQGLSFDGLDDLVQIPHDAALAFGSGDDFTLAFWAQGVGSQPGWAGVVTKSRDQAPWYGIWVASNRRWTSGGPQNISGSKISAGWHHLVLVQTGGSRLLYLDGVLNAQGSAQEASGVGDLVFGAALGVSEHFSGILDEVRLYRRALGAADVTGLYNLDPGALSVVAVDDNATVDQGGSVSIDLLANDSATLGLDAASVELMSAPGDGTLQIDPVTGEAVYQHDGSATSSDSFSYRVADSQGNLSNLAQVQLTIVPYLPPTVTITAPVSGAQVTGNLVLQWQTSGDQAAFDHIHVQLDDAPYVPLHDTSLTSYDFGPGSVGEHVMRVWLVDANHQALLNPEASDQVTVNWSDPAIVSPVQIDPPGGDFTSDVTVTLSADAGAAIHFTLDGSTPGAGSSRYEAPLLISQSLTLKAVAILDGVSSSVSSAQFNLDLPGDGLPRAGLVGYWPMDEGGGSQLLDASGSGLVGSISGALWAPGWAGSGLYFDGIDDLVSISHQPQLAFASGASFSLSAWVNLDGDQGGWAGVVTKSRDDSPWYGLWVASYDRWIFGGPTNLKGPLAEGGWQQLTLIQDGAAGSRSLYLNGTLVANGVAQHADGAGDLVLGGVQGVSEFFRGTLDEVRLYNRALSADEIQALATLAP
ncbi:LamG-like jellyroll fold domain-containing protein [Ferrimonas sediminicola]|nr:LamG-like jellyroll fold domain-containing protein [Ferrimonas sediminicola]